MKKINKTSSNNLSISNERLAEFIMIFEARTGIKLSEKEAQNRARALLRMMSILYKPVSIGDYISSMKTKLIIKKLKRREKLSLI